MFTRHGSCVVLAAWVGMSWMIVSSSCERQKKVVAEDSEVVSGCVDPENPNGERCYERDAYICDACEQLYNCHRFSSSSELTYWGLTGFPCSCLNEEGEFEWYDTATEEGNRECQTVDG